MLQACHLVNTPHTKQQRQLIVFTVPTFKSCKAAIAGKAQVIKLTEGFTASTRCNRVLQQL
jgi:hypothetical protein